MPGGALLAALGLCSRRPGFARSHLSKIFDKTGVARQAEPVRLLLPK
jgi:hypothetical protein